MSSLLQKDLLRSVQAVIGLVALPLLVDTLARDSEDTPIENCSAPTGLPPPCIQLAPGQISLVLTLSLPTTEPSLTPTSKQICEDFLRRCENI